MIHKHEINQIIKNIFYDIGMICLYIYLYQDILHFS